MVTDEANIAIAIKYALSIGKFIFSVPILKL